MSSTLDTSTPLSTPTLLGLRPEDIDALAVAVVAACSQLLPDPEPDRWLTTEEAAAYLAVPVSTIHKLTAAEAIPFSQEGPAARCYFLRSQIDLWRLESAFGPWRMTPSGR